MERNLKRIYWTIAAGVISLLPTTALAAPDAVQTVNNLKDFMISILSAVGVILVIWGIVQVAMGFQVTGWHTKGARRFVFLAGGALIAGIGPVLTALGF